MSIRGCAHRSRYATRHHAVKGRPQSALTQAAASPGEQRLSLTFSTPEEKQAQEVTRDYLCARARGGVQAAISDVNGIYEAVSAQDIPDGQDA